MTEYDSIEKSFEAQLRAGQNAAARVAGLFEGPSPFLSQRPERSLLWTRYMLGVIELERDRRRMR